MQAQQTLMLQAPVVALPSTESNHTALNKVLAAAETIDAKKVFERSVSVYVAQTDQLAWQVL